MNYGDYKNIPIQKDASATHKPEIGNKKGGEAAGREYKEIKPGNLTDNQARTSSAAGGIISPDKTIRASRPVAAPPPPAQSSQTESIEKFKVAISPDPQYRNRPITQHLTSCYQEYLEKKIDKKELFKKIDEAAIPGPIKYAGKKFIESSSPAQTEVEKLLNNSSIVGPLDTTDKEFRDLQKSIGAKAGDTVWILSKNNSVLSYAIKYDEKSKTAEIYRFSAGQGGGQYEDMFTSPPSTTSKLTGAEAEELTKKMPTLQQKLLKELKFKPTIDPKIYKQYDIPAAKTTNVPLEIIRLVNNIKRGAGESELLKLVAHTKLLQDKISHTNFDIQAHQVTQQNLIEAQASENTLNWIQQQFQ